MKDPVLSGCNRRTMMMMTKHLSFLSDNDALILGKTKISASFLL